MIVCQNIIRYGSIRHAWYESRVQTRTARSAYRKTYTIDIFIISISFQRYRDPVGKYLINCDGCVFDSHKRGYAALSSF